MRTSLVTWCFMRQVFRDTSPPSTASRRHTTGLTTTALSAVIVMFRAAGGAPNLKQPKVKVRLLAGPSPQRPVQARRLTAASLRAEAAVLARRLTPRTSLPGSCSSCAASSDKSVWCVRLAAQLC